MLSSREMKFAGGPYLHRSGLVASRRSQFCVSRRIFLFVKKGSNAYALEPNSNSKAANDKTTAVVSLVLKERAFGFMAFAPYIVPLISSRATPSPRLRAK